MLAEALMTLPATRSGVVSSRKTASATAGRGVSFDHVTQDDDEFVPAETRHDATRSHELLELLCNLHQQLVTDVVSVRVVDRP